MKKHLLVLLGLAFASSAFSQPSILNGNNWPTVGTTYSVFAATSGTQNMPGGASQIWNFSSVTFSYVGNANVVDPTTSLYGTSFPTANAAFTTNAGGTNSYYYFTNSASRFDCLAEGTYSPGTANDYSPNSKEFLKFPFNFTDSTSDVYQEVAQPTSTESLIYDGYGTLIMPTQTFSNVIRIRQVLSPSLTRIYWYNQSPLFPILIYKTTTNSLTAFLAGITGIKQNAAANTGLSIYPNPFTSQCILDFNSDQKNTIVKITDMLGKEIKSFNFSGTQLIIEKGEMKEGVYFVQITDEDKHVSNKKIIIQ